MRALAPFALLALAALSPAPIKDQRPFKPVPERSQAQLAKEMAYSGAYKTVGRIPIRSEPLVVPNNASNQPDARSVASASATLQNRDDGSIVRATAAVEKEQHAWHMPMWLLTALALGGAFGIVRGLRAWADKALPTPRR